MKNTKIKIILSAIIFFSILGFVGTASAAGASLNVSPSSLTKTVGDIFSASIDLSASGNKVCAVEGTLVFNNLSCQSITVADGVMAQSTPSCSNPSFLVGIPNCSTSDKALFTASVKAVAAGPASISFSSVDIIGEGTSVGSSSRGGNYTIDSVPVSIPAPATSQIQNNNSSADEKPAPEKKKTVPVETTATTDTAETLDESNQLAAVGEANSGVTGSTTIWIASILVAVLGAGYGVYYFRKKINSQR